MKTRFFLIMVLFLMVGLFSCAGKQDASLSAAINAQSANYAAYLEALNARPPVAMVTDSNGTQFVINQPPVLPPPPTIVVPDNPFVAGIKAVVNSTPAAILSGGWSASRLIRSATGDITASGQASVTSINNSHNPSTIRNADGNISEDNSDQSSTDSHNATADPTIIQAPDPVIVDPVVVDPVVVRPEVVVPGENDRDG